MFSVCQYGNAILTLVFVHSRDDGLLLDRVDNSVDVDATAIRLTLEMVKAEFAAVESNANAVDTSKE